MSVWLGALLGLMLLAAGVYRRRRSGLAGLRLVRLPSEYGTRGSTSATRPDLAFFCAESP